MLLAIHDLKIKADQHRRYSKASQHHKSPGIIQLIWRSTGGIGAGKNVADQDREKPKSDILDPENQGISRSDNLLIHELGNRRPQGRGDQGEAGSKNEDRDVSDYGSADSAALEQRQDEGGV